MQKLLIGLCALVIGGVLVVNDVEAKRIGGARSSGVQRNVTNTPPASTPAKPAQQQAAGQQAGQQAAPAAGGAAAAAPASGFAKWAPLLGGLAIGGLLGSMLGGSGFGALLLMVLLALGAFVAYRVFAARREQGSHQTMQYAGMNERVSVPAQPQSAGLASQPAPAAAAASVPAGFDVAGFLRGAKLNFVKLQVANDAGKLDEIREFTTPEMFDEIAKDRTAGQQTDVLSLNADLLEVTTEGDKHWASVRFSGLVRETPGTEPVEFQEVWNLAKPVDGSSGWLLAGIQQMQ